MNGVCSPNIEIDISKHYTCFTYSELKEIALAFNIFIQTNKVCGITTDGDICIPRKLINISKKNKKELWESIYRRLKPICKYEYCWLDLDFISIIPDPYLKEKIEYFTFKPQIPSKKYSWLNTRDINNVLQQYQEVYDSFKFIGAVPSDFYKVTTVYYKDIFDYEKIGVVLNLDNHKQQGSHWVALLIDNKNKSIEYFDSAGKIPNRNIKIFINKLSKYCKNYKIHINKIKHQYENNECGIYAIYFIIQRLKNNSFESICNSNIPDEKMNKFRNVIFRPRTFG